MSGLEQVKHSSELQAAYRARMLERLTRKQRKDAICVAGREPDLEYSTSPYPDNLAPIVMQELMALTADLLAARLRYLREHTHITDRLPLRSYP